ncbi:RHS repeat-associated core domain-containing protein [Dyella sp. C9]|uniref:RHS repeat-associated core domain-containing protein n=1 Tax=Dyella sp. C9 TaxID=2202154 RepID=UPI000DEF5880|nr:RHS repeat-associated core domain-containing protein [Dyella sp. C9]
MKHARIPGSTHGKGLALGGALLFMAAPAAFAQTVVTKYSYDTGDNLTTVTDPRGLATHYTHDGLGQLWQQVSPDTGTTSFSYDAYGRLASLTRANGAQTTYGYDGIGRRTSVSAGGSTQTMTYDSCTNGAGRLCTATDPTGKTTYTYSPEGRLTGRGFAMGSTSYALGYSYNAQGQVTAVAYPDGVQAIYTYSLGVVSTLQVKSGSTTANVATGVAYQPGNAAMAQWTASNGLVNSLTYDADGRLTSITAPSVQGLALSYDTANRIVGITNSIDSAMTQSFGYDGLSRLTSVYGTADNEALQYDANGNRTSQLVNGTTVTVTTGASSNQQTRLSGGASTSYGYDAKGNLTTVNGTATFTYDAFNRLQAAGTASYYVNPEGQRLRKVAGSVTTYFAPDATGPLLAENPGSAGWIDYIWLNGRLVGRLNAGQLLAIHDDQLGRPEVMTDTNKTIVWRARNFAFDRTVTVANAVPLNLGFPGQYYDAESGLWNNGFRDYSPAAGRYIESDPLGLAAGINTYAYVGSNPLINADPYGLWTFQIGLSLSGSLGPLSFNGSFGIALDSCGTVAAYKEGGFGTGAGADVQVGVGVHTTNGDTLSDLNGPFVNGSVSAGEGVSGTLDALVGTGSHGQVVSGGGFTVGAGLGGATSTSITNTTISSNSIHLW